MPEEDGATKKLISAGGIFFERSEPVKNFTPSLLGTRQNQPYNHCR
jgi:hypothetical protein